MTNAWLYIMDGSGMTPLDRAFGSGHRAIAEALMNQEKALDAKTDGTPLHRAALKGLTAAVSSLLRCAADPRARNAQGETPLHLAVREGHYDTARVLLEQSKADPNATCTHGLTPLHWASITGRGDLFELLLAHGGDPWVRGEYLDGLTSIDIAMSMGYAELTEWLEQRLLVA